MSKEIPSVPSIARYDANSSRFESNENEFDDLLNPVPLPPPRTPLNSIPDPSQCQELEPTPRGKPEVVRSFRSVDKRADASDIHAISYNRNGTPGHANKGKALLETSSAQSTPARRVSNIGASGARSALYTGGKAGNLTSRVSRGIPLVNCETSVEVPHFELVEDPSFWKDHNVQVLIRIRPLSDVEKVSQGYGRCLRQESAQTLVWLGHPETRFTFDHVACETISQEKLFRVAGLPMVENCMSGYNSCMFAYGQTGSGKTYTMMGEIVQMNGKLNDHSGITPRIFEYLFSRIREEEEKQSTERLKFSCKCSFLEIYNEHITDLLEPSSTNLHLREDLKKGVYVENLTEVSVSSVNDVLKVLLQGAANRKIAATHMNSESSRSHSVFTCNIESCWEKDSMKHFRFGRLNLVDLAGSERQKSSGADGDRLKEAANINKSLSTLGLVIMSLVDLAQGKQRHVPYRDSRLTFLLQDSLGGNSKTTIIANVSPSSCSANETLSTLKFAQRAKLIQNNAKVNEDASGDVSILQQQIQLLKGQLSFLMKHHSSSKHISHLMLSLDQSSLGYLPERFDLSNEMNVHHDDDHRTCGRNSKIEKLKATVLGALRREKLVEMEVRRLEAEIEQMNRLVYQQEEDSQRNKMMLRFREEKIKRFELLEDGLISADKYLINENAALREEIQRLEARIERNPEHTRLVLENNRLLRQLRVFQNFYDHGQRERLVAEISELRDQFLELIEHGGNYWMPKHASREGYQVGSVLDESELVKSTPHPLPVHEEDFLDKSNQRVENALILEYADMKKQLMESRSLMEEMELQQVHLIEGIEVLKEENCRLLGMVDRNEHIRKQPGSLCESCESQVCLEYTDLNLALRGSADITLVGLQAKLEKVSKDLEEACLVNGKCIEEHAQTMTMKHQHELICEEVEMETAKTILLLQEEISQIKSEFQEKLSSMAEEIISLKDTLAAKEEEMKVVCAEWERATLDLTNFLTDGSKSLQDAGWQIESIACSFPNVDLFIGEHVERAAKTYIEKEETILLLKKSLEEAQQTVFQMEEKLLSLKGATIAFAEAQQQVNDASSEEGIQLATGLSDTTRNITFLENKLIHSEVQINEAERCASFDLSAVNSVSDLPELTYVIDIKDQPLISVQNFGMTGFNNEIESTKREVLELENAIKTSCHDAERLFSVIKSDGYNNVLFFKDLIQDIVNDIRELQRQFTELKEKHGRVQLHSVGVESSNSNEISGCYTVCQMLHKILYELVGTNDSLNHINACFYKLLNPYGYLGAAEESINSDGSTDCSTSSSYPSDGSDGSILSSDLRGSNIVQNLVMNSSQEEILYFLSKEFRSTYNVFAKLKAHFDTSFCWKEIHNCLCSSPCFSNLLELSKSNDHCVMGNESEVIMPEVVPGLEVIMSEAETGCNLVRELKLNDKTSQASRFFNKFEEAYRTIKEADHTLQALTKANEGAKELNCMWKRAGEEFMVERARLDEEIRQLNSDVNGTESKYGKLQNQMHHTFTEIASSISSIEDTFQETQKYVDTLCKSVLSDAFGMVKETMSCICNSRLLLEEIFTNIEGTGLASLVLNRNVVFQPAALQEGFLALSSTGESYETYDNGMLRKVKAPTIKTTGSEEIDLVHANSMNENTELRRELERKEALLKGLLFDFSLLQESASSKKDVKDEIDKLIAALSQVENELRIKNNQHNDMIVQHRTLENQFKEAQSALFSSHSDLLEARRKLEILSKENAELRELLEDIYLKKSETEEELREQMKAVEMLEKEIILLTSSTDNQVNGEKIQLLEQVRSLQDKLDIACALANENEAIAVEARQESEASKIYAEQKEEEVKILEHSVEELDGTINILEKKVHEMEEEVEQHHMIRESLELELQALKERLLTVENFTEKLELKNSGSQLTKDQFPRSLSHQKAYDQIKILEIEKAELVKEVKQCKEYISELLLHAEAQALQYQQKYKDLEAMVHEFRTDSSNLENQVSTSDKIEKVSTRIRGSSSPFRCISSLVQQMNSEKDQELSVAKLRIEELEALAVQRQKEVCILNNRLAAAENMTHDVIRDLLGVKLDMTIYADLIDQHQLQKFIVEAHQQSLEYSAMEKEVLNLRRQLNDLIEEREAFILQVKRREAIELATQMSIEQLRERDQLLTAQNEMLKVDKTNLQSKVVEMDEMVKNLLGTQNIQPQNHSLLRLDDADRGKRLVNSKKLALGMNDKSYHYYRGPKGTK